jgi:AraC family transcriptional regulator
MTGGPALRRFRPRRASEAMRGRRLKINDQAAEQEKKAEMQQIMRPAKESGPAAGAQAREILAQWRGIAPIALNPEPPKLVREVAANTTAMRAEFLCKRKPTIGPVEFHFVQPKLALCWFRRNVNCLKGKIDGRGIDVPLAGRSSLCIIPEGVEFQGGFDVQDVFAYARVFFARDRVPEEYRSLVREPVLGFCHDALTRGLAELSKELSIQDNVFPLMADGWMLQALAHMARVTNAKDPFGEGRHCGLAPWQLRRATDFICAHLNGNISLEQLASACDLSVSHFARGFKKGTGLPPYRWLVEMRLEKVKDLLLNTKMPLAEVAVACGFADQSHFTKTFVRTIGSTPGIWRRERAIDDSVPDME